MIEEGEGDGEREREKKGERQTDENNQVTYRSKNIFFLFLFFCSTTKTAARVEKKGERENKKEGVSLLLGTGNIKASRETENLSALRQNTISSESFDILSLSLFLFLMQ